MIKDIEVYVTWKGLDLIVTIEDADWFPPDEWTPTLGYVEIDYILSNNRPLPLDGLMRQIQAQIDDEPDRFFKRICEECEAEIYEQGCPKYLEAAQEAAEVYYAC